MFILGFGLILIFGKSWRKATVDGLWYVLVDVYCLIWTIILVVCYANVFNDIQDVDKVGEIDWSNLSFTVPGALAVLRLYEFWSFIGGLHSHSKYTTFNRLRATINTFWHYVVSIIAFATIYIWIAFLFGDPFAADSNIVKEEGRLLVTCKGAVAHDWVTPLYFSTISIATIGYGDFAPQTPEGRGVVISQIFFGIFLFVVILQRALVGEESKDGNPPEGDRNVTIESGAGI
jgi:hypothetical protein